MEGEYCFLFYKALKATHITPPPFPLKRYYTIYTNLIVIHVVSEAHMVAGTRTSLQMVLEIQVQIDVFPVQRARNVTPIPVLYNGLPSGALLLAAVQLELRTRQPRVHSHACGQLAAAPLLQQPFHHGAVSANSLQNRPEPDG